MVFELVKNENYFDRMIKIVLLEVCTSNLLEFTLLIALSNAAKIKIFFEIGT